MAPVDVVERYLVTAPVKARPGLRAIRAAAPDAEEGLSYGMPFYGHPGAKGIERRLCYFRLRRDGIGLYLRPNDLEPHRARVARYRSTGSALFFPAGEPIPVPLIRVLVRDGVARHRSGPRRSRPPKKTPRS